MRLKVIDSQRCVGCQSCMFACSRRLGMGAVMGSKNLKALVVSGKNSIPLADKKLHCKVYNEIYDAAVNLVQCLG
ncbi:MAG TPA: hypothetical protein ENN58_03370 [bacterium]|nr:hypothetical protein [bacterium]